MSGFFRGVMTVSSCEVSPEELKAAGVPPDDQPGNRHTAIVVHFTGGADVLGIGRALAAIVTSYMQQTEELMTTLGVPQDIVQTKVLELVTEEMRRCVVSGVRLKVDEEVSRGNH